MCTLQSRAPGTPLQNVPAHLAPGVLSALRDPGTPAGDDKHSGTQGNTPQGDSLMLAALSLLQSFRRITEPSPGDRVSLTQLCGTNHMAPRTKRGQRGRALNWPWLQSLHTSEHLPCVLGFMISPQACRTFCYSFPLGFNI